MHQINKMTVPLQVPPSGIKWALLRKIICESWTQRDIGGLIDLIDIFLNFPFRSGTDLSFADISRYYWSYGYGENWSQYVRGLQASIYGKELITVEELDTLATLVSYRTSHINSKLYAVVLNGQVLSIRGPDPRIEFFSVVSQRMPLIRMI